MTTERTPLEYQASKNEQSFIPYYLERLQSFPEGEWVRPSNQDKPDYDIFRWFEAAGLVQSRRTPIWSGGGMRGHRVEFLYRHDLQYT